MATNRKSTKKQDSNQTTVPAKPDKGQAVAFARTLLRPTFQAALTLKEYNKSLSDIDLCDLIESLVEQTQAGGRGDLKRAEAMLTAQAHSLDAIINNLARRAITAEYMDNLERYLKLSLRAQSQCRATWEALATIQNPPVLGYVKQANIAHGPQQVNNAPAAPEEAKQGQENSNLRNKVLEENGGERLDIGTTSTPIQADPEMATVGAVDRPENRSG